MTVRVGSRQKAARRQLRAMKSAGLVDDDGDAALIDLVLGLAKAIDEDPEPKAALWKEYREALGVLRQAGEAIGDEDEADVLELVQLPLRPAMGNTAKS